MEYGDCPSSLKNNNNHNHATLLVEGSGHVATAGGCVLVKLLPQHPGHRLNVKAEPADEGTGQQVAQRQRKLVVDNSSNFEGRSQTYVRENSQCVCVLLLHTSVLCV